MLIGDEGVGKTTFKNILMNGKFTGTFSSSHTAHTQSLEITKSKYELDKKKK